ncbi:hypothetical protein KJ763_01785 [Patescibacteria group bacterium]|nr:hypothetical protein [Patescibacteria group bacterium]
MRILPVNSEIKKYLKKHELEKKFQKQIKLFQENVFYPSLETELLEPKQMRIWSFRIDRKYRAVFIFREKDLVEIVTINNHYK